ncbi:MAG TPA: hypothetical protein VGB98_25795 [Pyrinomonadaceae bacterium]
MKGRGAAGRIVRALGIQTGDVIRAGVGGKVYEVAGVGQPRNVLVNPRYVIILDHPETSLSLIERGQPRGGHYQINDVRREGGRWFTAANVEIYVERPPRAPVPAASLFDLIDPPDAVEELAAPAPYSLNPRVDYHAGPRRVWRCEDCGEDFNTPGPSFLCAHGCGGPNGAIPVYYVQAPEPGDRRTFTSYALMTLNHGRYEAISYGTRDGRHDARAEAA